MRYRYLALMGVLAAVAVVSLVVVLIGARVPRLTATADGTSFRTSWGDPDLQGIWNDRYQTPLQRPAKYAGREFLTEEEVAALDSQRAAIPSTAARAAGEGQRSGRRRRI